MYFLFKTALCVLCFYKKRTEWRLPMQSHYKCSRKAVYECSIGKAGLISQVLELHLWARVPGVPTSRGANGVLGLPAHFPCLSLQHYLFHKQDIYTVEERTHAVSKTGQDDRSLFFSLNEPVKWGALGVIFLRQWNRIPAERVNLYAKVRQQLCPLLPLFIVFLIEAQLATFILNDGVFSLSARGSQGGGGHTSAVPERPQESCSPGTYALEGRFCSLIRTEIDSFEWQILARLCFKKMLLT